MEKPSLFTPDNNPEKNIWYHIDAEEMGNKHGLAFKNWYIYAPTNNDIDKLSDLVIAHIPNNHLQYAFIWFSLAIILASITFIYIRQITRR